MDAITQVCLGLGNGSTPSPCFMPSSANTPGQFTLLLNLLSFMFCLMTFYWFICTCHFLWEYNFLFMHFLFMLNLLGTQAGHKVMPCCILRWTLLSYLFYSWKSFSKSGCVSGITSIVVWKVACSSLTSYCQ